MKSRLVLNAALRDPKVARLPSVAGRADPLDWLEKRVSADFEVAPEVLRISVTGDNEKEAVDLANAVREAYLREIVEKEQELRVKRLDKLKSLYDKYDDHLRTKRRKLREAQGTGGGGAHQWKLRLAGKRLDAVQQELLQVQAQLRKGRIELGALKASANGRPGSAAPGAAEELRQKLQVLQELEQVLGKEVEAQTREVQGLTDSIPDVGWLRDEIAQVEELTRRIGREIQSLQVEAEAPPRIRLLQEATRAR